MDNVFSKLGVTRELRMYATKDGKQRYYGQDIDYFVSNNINLKDPKYTICGAGSSFYSYAVLDMYGATLEAGYCKGEEIEIVNEGRVKYLVVCGTVADLETLMVLNASKEDVGPNPPYQPCPDDQGGGGGGTADSAVLLAYDFVWDGNRTYTIHSFVNSYIDELKDLPNDFVVYIDDADQIVANAQVSLFGMTFDLYHINGNVIEKDINAVPNVLPILFSKSARKARMLYSYLATVQTGYGWEDVFLDFDEDEQPKD